MLLMFVWPPWLVGIVTVLFLLICVMMVLTVLIQRPQGGGLSGAFGSGAGSGQTAFGAKTGDALTIFTIIVFILFLGTAISLNYGYRPSANVIPASGKGEPGTEQAPADQGAPATTAPGQPAPITGDQAPTGAPAPGDQPQAQPSSQPLPTAPAEKPAEPAPPPPADQPK